MSDISPITESIRLYAKQIRVPSFAKYNEILRHAGGGMGYEEFLLELMKKELETRRENQQKRRTRAAGFPFLKTLDEFDYSRLEVSVKKLTDINTKKFAIQLNYQKYRRFFN